MTPFDRARSPWEAYLFEGLPDGRAAHMLKMHHSTTDGMGSVQLFSQLHSRTRESNPLQAATAVAAPRAADVGRSAARAARARRAGGAGARAVRGRRRLQRAHPAASRRSASLLGFVSSLARVTAEPAREGLAAAPPPQSLLALPRARRRLRRSARRGQGGRRVAERRVRRGAARRVSPLPRGARPPDRRDADGDSDLGAPRGRRGGRQSHRGRALRRAGRHRRSAQAHAGDRRARRLDPERAGARRHVAARAGARAPPRRAPDRRSPAA